MVQKDVKAAALMTAPRYECVEARTRIERTMHTMGVPLTISGGVYYGQCMQAMMESVVNSVDYIITLDFDTMCLPKHVLRLISIATQENLDALAAMQPMRGQGRLLASRQKDNEVVWTGRPIEVETAHFGLTVINAHKLKEVPKPWFLAVPDEDGGWSDDRVDSDVYFWRNWARHGCRVFIDPGCRIGHLEEVVTVYDGTMQPKHYYPKEWAKIAETTCDG